MKVIMQLYQRIIILPPYILNDYTFQLQKLLKQSNINPSFLKDILTPKIWRCDILVKHPKSAKYGEKHLIALGPKIWNQLRSNVKTLTSITKYQEYIRTWLGPSCKFNIC